MAEAALEAAGRVEAAMEAVSVARAAGEAEDSAAAAREEAVRAENKSAGRSRRSRCRTCRLHLDHLYAPDRRTCHHWWRPG